MLHSKRREILQLLSALIGTWLLNWNFNFKEYRYSFLSSWICLQLPVKVLLSGTFTKRFNTLVVRNTFNLIEGTWKIKTKKRDSMFKLISFLLTDPSFRYRFLHFSCTIDTICSCIGKNNYSFNLSTTLIIHFVAGEARVAGFKSIIHIFWTNEHAHNLSLLVKLQFRSPRKCVIFSGLLLDLRAYSFCIWK